MDDTITVKQTREEDFVAWVLKQMQTDNAIGAALRRADNPATEYQSWEYLARWCDLDKDWDRRPYTTVAAAIAHAKPLADGRLGIGKAIAACYEEGNKSDQAKAKLRRLLVCSSVKEVCRILRPLLRLISSRSVQLCYGKLLQDLVYFGGGEKAREKWAVDFYGRSDHDSFGA